METYTKKATKTPFSKVVQCFNWTGIIHTIFSVSVFVLSLLNLLYKKDGFYITVQVLSIVSLFNSLIWIISAIVLFCVVGKIETVESPAKSRFLLFLAVLFVLTPDILTSILFWIPSLKNSGWINFIGIFSPVLVFVGWFIGKRVGKKAKPVKVEEHIQQY